MRRGAAGGTNPRHGGEGLHCRAGMRGTLGSQPHHPACILHLCADSAPLHISCTLELPLQPCVTPAQPLQPC